jgi:Rrf2 family protein
MIGLGSATAYAVKALGCLDHSEERWVLAREISDKTGVPLPYLSKILHGLGRTGLVLAKRGYRGGFRLSRPASQVSVAEVARAVEGDDWAEGCLLGLHQCSDERACPLHQFWKNERGRVREKLESVTLQEVAEFELARGRGVECHCSRCRERARAAENGGRKSATAAASATV